MTIHTPYSTLHTPHSTLKVSPPPLEIATLLLTLRLETRASLPSWKGQLVSLLRGRLGPLLVKRECASSCAPLQGQCIRGGVCSFLSVFAPVSPDPAQSPEPGAKEPPRPYAFLPPLDERKEFSRGDILMLRLILIGKGIEHAYSILYTIREALQNTIRVQNSLARYELVKIESIDPFGGPGVTLPPSLLDESGRGMREWLQVTTGSRLLAQAAALPDRLTLRFISPVSIMENGKVVRLPYCPPLVECARRRLSLLCYHYGSGSWPMVTEKVYKDQIREMAWRVRVEDRQIDWFEWSRVKNELTAPGPVTGFMGRVTYSDLPLPLRLLLLAGSVVQLGDNVVFGNGAYVVELGDKQGGNAICHEE